MWSRSDKTFTQLNIFKWIFKNVELKDEIGKSTITIILVTSSPFSQQLIEQLARQLAKT